MAALNHFSLDAVQDCVAGTPGRRLIDDLTRHLSENVDEEAEAETNAPHDRTGTILSSWSVMANTTLGVGMLALPWASAQVGWVCAFGYLSLAGLFALLSLVLLSRIALHVGGKDTTFYSVCVLYAPRTRVLVDLAIVVKCFGVCTSYLQIVAQNILSVLRPQQGDLLLVRAMIISITLLSAVPVAYRRRIGNTRLTNWLSLACILYVWLILIVACFPLLVGGPEAPASTAVNIGHDMEMWPVSAVNVLTTIPVFIFSFTCHQNLFSVANEIKEPSFKRLLIPTSASVSTALFIYGVCIALGCMAFGQSVANNFLISLPQGIPTQLGSILMAVSNAFSICLQLHPCRRSLMVLFNTMTGLEYEYPQRGERLLRRVLTTFILVGTGIVATFVADLGIVFELVGAIGSNTICYIMPAFLYIRASKGMPNSSRVLYGLAVLQFCVGLIVLPTCLFAIFYKATHPK